MARYQLRRPTPVKVVLRHARREDSVTSTMPVLEGEALDEGPESPDSLASSPSTIGEQSESEDSESEDEEEPSSSVQSGVSYRTTRTLGATSTTAAPISLASTVPAFTVNITSQGTNTAMPQITGTTLSTRTRAATTSTTMQDASQSERQKQATATSSLSALAPTAEPETSGESEVPQRAFPQQEERPIMTKGAAVAASVLGVLGASPPICPPNSHT
jgi:hypothetical protein